MNSAFAADHLMPSVISTSFTLLIHSPTIHRPPSFPLFAKTPFLILTNDKQPRGVRM